MGKLDTNIKCMEVQKLVEEKQYKQALEVLDTIDIRKVKSVIDLKLFAEVYQVGERYEDAKDVLLRVYEKKPNKRVVYRLSYLAAARGNFEEAEDFFQEFVELAPNDWEQFVLWYGIQKAKKECYDGRIETLEKLKGMEYIEEWGYELAKLYHKAGRGQECVEECSDLILWFGEGIIVEKAKLLRTYHLEGKETLDAYGVFDTKKENETVDKKRQVLRKELDRDLNKTLNLQQVMRQELETKEMKELRYELEEIWEDHEHLEHKVSQDTMPIAPEMEELPVVQMPSGLKLEVETKKGKEKSKHQTRKMKKDQGVLFSKEEWLGKVKEVGEKSQEQNIDYRDAINKQVTRVMKPVDTSIKVGQYDLSKIFSVYLENNRIREQIKTELKRVKPGEEAVNFIISGQPIGGMELARALGIALKEMDVIQSNQIAKISAEKLNKIQLIEKQDKLKHGCVVIEDAGAITADTAQSVINMMSELEKDIVVILIDKNEAIADLFEKYKVLGKYFKYNIAL